MQRGQKTVSWVIIVLELRSNKCKLVPSCKIPCNHLVSTLRPRIQGVGVRELLVEKPVARELCDKARDHPPPTPQLGEEADYFRPSSTQV